MKKKQDPKPQNQGQHNQRKMVGSNIDRHYSASYALSAFEKITGPGEPREQVLSDLLCNLMHVARAEGLVFQRALDSAEMHYQAETGWRCPACLVLADGEDHRLTFETCPGCGIKLKGGDTP